MVSVRQGSEECEDIIVVRNNDADDGPVVYTTEEAESLREELDRVLD